MAIERKSNLPRVITVKELSEYLRVHPSTIYKLLQRGELPGFRIGTDWRFNVDVLDRFYLKRSFEDSADSSPDTPVHTPAKSAARSARRKPKV